SEVSSALFRFRFDSCNPFRNAENDGISRPMSPRSGPSAGILAAAVSAILFGALLAATIVFGFYAIWKTNALAHDANLPPYAKLLFEIVWGAFFIGAGVLVATGAGAFQLRRWARISMLVFSGMFLFFGVLGIFVILFVVLASPLPGPPTAKF